MPVNFIHEIPDKKSYFVHNSCEKLKEKMMDFNTGFSDHVRFFAQVDFANKAMLGRAVETLCI